MARRAARQLGADDMVLYLGDHEQCQLLPLPGPDATRRESLAIEGNPGRPGVQHGRRGVVAAAAVRWPRSRRSPPCSPSW
ncbi:hypothetical protein [Micromonospora sp. 4G55]|uniref:hypothetical protein n=1 Tax=Micromonospora sp. 4G55 TaxID=2806102 RepID=UPI001EE42DDF|nr:hypothetical protein [Micromonospora sp. 4G55]